MVMSCNEDASCSQKLKFEVSSEWRGRTSNFMKAREFGYIVDEPVVFEGSNLGPNPAEMLLSAIAGCISTGSELIARGKGVEFDSFEVNSSAEIDLSTVVLGGFSLVVRVKGDADEAALRSIVQEAFDGSPIVGSLKTKPEFKIIVE